mgnify:CR=1 FL=1
MNESTKTKKALRGSLFALFLCIVLLIGTTFAWFTDTASTGVNKIQSGRLDVSLEKLDTTHNKWVSAENDILTFKTADNRTADEILWEPGCTYELPQLRVVNNGNLALKYKIKINGIQGDEKLNEVIDWTINDKAINLTEQHLTAGQSDTFTIKGHMQESAGNDYQGLSIDGISITVVATQDTVENDSYGNTYDANATYPVSDAASIADAVADLATAGSKNVVVTVGNDLTGTSGIKTAKGNTFTLDMNGKTVGVKYGDGSSGTTTNGMQLLQGSTVTLKNGTYKAEHGEDADHNIAILIQNYSNLTIDNCNLDMREANDTAGNSRGTSYVVSSNCGNVTIKGNTNIFARSDDEYALDVMHWENASYKKEGTHVVFDESMTGTVDGKIDVYCYRNGATVKPVDDGGATLVIKGGTFKNSGLTLAKFKAFVPSGYTVTTNADGSFTVSK